MYIDQTFSLIDKKNSVFIKMFFFLLLKKRKMNTVERASFVHSKEGNDAATCLSKKDQLITYFFI